MILCPYCHQEMKGPPKRAKKCPLCQNRVYALPGDRYVTEAEHKQFRATEAKEYRQKTHLAYREQVLGELLTAKGSGVVLGIKALGSADSCGFCKQMDGRRISLDDAIAHEHLRPPFDQCTNDVCQCSYVDILANLDTPSAPSTKLTASRCLWLLIVAFVVCVLALAVWSLI